MAEENIGSNQLQDEEEKDPVLNQELYEPTEYEDASWEIVGEVADTKEFQPMAIEVMPGHGRDFDPMFADFGGLPPEEAAARWHLPEDIAFQNQSTNKSENPEDQEERKSLTDAEITEIKKRAYARGKKEGYESAVERSHQKLAAAEERMRTVLEDVARQIDEYLGHIEQQAVDLALAVSRKVIDQAVEINPEYIVAIINEAIGLAGTATIRTIRVSQDDLEFIELVGIRRSMKETEGNWEFVGDETIKSGCIVETSAGEIDYQLDPAWERIKEQVVRICK